MKRAIFALAVLLCAGSARAQPTVTINGVSWVPNLGFTPTTQPSTSTEGIVYYDSAGHALKFYNGTSWRNVGPATTDTLQLARLGLGVAAGGVALLTLTDSATVPAIVGSNAAYGVTPDGATAAWLAINNSSPDDASTATAFQFRSGRIVGWMSNNGALSGSVDTAVARNAARVAEINNGTAGTFGDLITRSLATGAATYGSAPIGTVGSGTGITVNATGDVRDVVNKVTLTFAAFSAAATTADATIYTLAAKQKLLDIYADVTQVFSGGAVSAATMTCGITAGGNTLLVSFDIKTATITRGLADADLGTALTRATAIQGGYMPSWTATTTVQCRVTTVSANTNALTQGSVTFYLTTRAF